MRLPSGDQPSPLEIVTPFTTAVSVPPVSSRYSTPSGWDSPMSMEPIQTRPAGSTAPSLNRMPSLAGAAATVRPAQPSPGPVTRNVSRFPPAVSSPPPSAENAAETSPRSTLLVSPSSTRVMCSIPRGMSTQDRQSSSGRQYGPSPSTAATSPTGSAVVGVSTSISAPRHSPPCLSHSTSTQSRVRLTAFFQPAYPAARRSSDQAGSQRRDSCQLARSSAVSRQNLLGHGEHPRDKVL